MIGGGAGASAAGLLLILLLALSFISASLALIEIKKQFKASRVPIALGLVFTLLSLALSFYFSKLEFFAAILLLIIYLAGGVLWRPISWNWTTKLVGPHSKLLSHVVFTIFSLILVTASLAAIILCINLLAYLGSN